MGRSIQGLEDLYHGFPVDGVGQRHSALALEAVIGAGHHLGGDFEGLVLPPHKSFQCCIEYSLTFCGQLVICRHPPTSTACSNITNPP